MIRGIDDLVDLRLRGIRPALGVFWELREDDIRPFNVDVTVMAELVSPVDFGDHPDLRALVGMKVLVIGPVLHAAAVLKACGLAEKAGATRVIGYATDRPWKLADDALVHGEIEWQS